MPKSIHRILVFLILLVLGGATFRALYALRPPEIEAAAGSKLSVSERAELQIVQHQDGELILDISFPDIQIERDEETGFVKGIDQAGTETSHETGVPRLPRYSRLLDCLPGHVGVQILDIESEEHNLGTMAPNPPDIQVDFRPSSEDEMDGSLDEAGPRPTWTELSAATPRKPGWWPGEVASLKEGGVYRGHRLVNLVVNPVRVNAELGTARVVRRVKLRVTMPRSEEAGPRIPDSPSETRTIREMLGPLAVTALPNRMAEAFSGRDNQRQRLDEGPVGGRWKIIVNSENIYRVTAEDLRAAGCPVEQITTHDAHLKNRGVDVPFYFAGEADGRFDENDYFEFFGVPNRQTYTSYSPAFYSDPWTNENVYWFSWGDGIPGVRLGEEDGAFHSEWPQSQVRNVSTVRCRLHFEGESKFDRLSRSYLEWGSRLASHGPLGVNEDHWFWGEHIPGLSSRSFRVNILFPDQRSLRPVSVRAALQGFNWFTGFIGSGAHRAIVYLNGVTAPGLQAGQTSINDGNPPWNNQQAVIVQTAPGDSVGILTTDLVSGHNDFTVSLPGDGLAGANDKIYANWFEIEYDRSPRSFDGFIRFSLDTTRGDTFAFDIRGFRSRNISLWKLGQTRLTNLDVRRVTPADESASYAAKFQIITNDAYDLILFDDTYPIAPLEIVPESSTRDLRTLPGAEYLIIYHDLFDNDLSLLRLDSLRRVTFNGSVDTIKVSQIYEQFNHGVKNPEAIREFLKYAYEHWSIRPTHACLVGDGVMEPKLRREPGDLIPSLYPSTLDFGVAAADMLFGCVSGPPWDVTPDIAVGRISCRTPEELQTYVEKLVAYDDPTQSNYQTLYHATTLFVSDKRDGTFNFDRNFSEPTVRRMPPTVVIDRVYLDSVLSGQGFNTLRDAMRQGAVIINYNGHGGGGLWSGINLLDVPRMRLLVNNRSLPFISNFTCYVGVFDVRNQTDALGEAFLFTRNGRGDPVGAIGVYSSSGVGWAYAGVDMQSYLFDFITQGDLTIGQIVQINKSRFWAAQPFTSLAFTNVFSMMMMMNLLGDPGVKLALPQNRLTNLEPDTTIVSAGDWIRVRGTLPWTPSASRTEIYLLPSNGENFQYFQQWQRLPNGDSIRVLRSVFRNDKVPAYDPANPTFQLFREAQFECSLQVRTGSTAPWNRLITPQGRVVVYAVDQGLKTDAIGSFPIYLADSLGRTRVVEVQVLPRGYVLNDSLFQIQTRLMHRSGLEQVRFRGVFAPAQGPVVVDSASLQEIEPGLWRTPDLGPHRVAGGNYRIKFFAKPFGGDWETTSDYDLLLENYGNFDFNRSSGLRPQVIPGNQPTYVVRVGHLRFAGNARIAEVPLTFLAVGDSFRIQRRFNQPDTLITVRGVDTIRANATIRNPFDLATPIEVRFPVTLRPYTYRVTCRIDPDNLVRETNEQDNTLFDTIRVTTLYPATRAHGTYVERPFEAAAFHRYWANGQTDVIFRYAGDPNPLRINVRDTLWVRLLPQTLPMDSGCLILSGPTVLPKSELTRLAVAGLSAPAPDSFGYLRSFSVALGDSSETLLPDGRAQLRKNFVALARGSTERAALLQQLRLFRQRSGSSFWQMLSNPTVTVLDEDTSFRAAAPLDTFYLLFGRISAESEGLGRFAVFRFTDSRGPDIQLAVAGLRFTPGSLLPRRPEIFVNLDDAAGIDRRGRRFQAVLDGDTIPPAEIAWTDSSEWGGRMTAVLRPELEAGTHTLFVRATDNLGNTDTMSTYFVVRGDFGIEWVMNYPNPFQNSTTISYLLTDATDDFVEIKIFTVAGRHIRTLNELDRAVANYRTLVWDGRDEHGDEVANGVYFARIKARQGKNEVEKMLKLAKVR